MSEYPQHKVILKTMKNDKDDDYFYILYYSDSFISIGTRRAGWPILSPEKSFLESKGFTLLNGEDSNYYFGMITADATEVRKIKIIRRHVRSNIYMNGEVLGALAS